MFPFKATHQLLSGMLLILILPSRPASCPVCHRLWTPEHRLLSGVEVLKTYEEKIFSLQGNTLREVPSDKKELLDLVCNLEILHALTKKVDRNLSELIHQIVKDAGKWLSFIHKDDANNESYERHFYEYCLQPYLENITQFAAFDRIEGPFTGQCNDPPSSEVLQTMWIYSNSEDLSNINCSSLYAENDCTQGNATVTGGSCPICEGCITE